MKFFLFLESVEIGFIKFLFIVVKGGLVVMSCFLVFVIGLILLFVIFILVFGLFEL